MKIVYLNKKEIKAKEPKGELQEAVAWMEAWDIRRIYLKYKNRLDGAGISYEEFFLKMKE